MVDLGPEEHEQRVGGEEEEARDVQQDVGHHLGPEPVQGSAHGEHAGAHPRADKVEQVEHLLRRPPRVKSLSFAGDECLRVSDATRLFDSVIIVSLVFPAPRSNNFNHFLFILGVVCFFCFFDDCQQLFFARAPGAEED